MEKHESLGYLLSKGHYLLEKKFSENFKDAGLDLTKEQYVVLNIIWEAESVNQQFIADELNKNKFSITKLIDGLEKRSLVKRIADKNDRRNKLIIASEYGNSLKDKIKGVAQKSFDEAIVDISIDKEKELKQLLRKILINLGEEINE